MPCFLIWFQKYSIKKVYLILKIILIGIHFKGNVEALHQSILWNSVLYTLSEINGKAAVLARNVTRKVCVEEMQQMYTCGHFFMDKKTGWLINWELQKSSSLIGHLTTVCICEWLTKVKQIYDPSFLLFHVFFCVSRFIVTLIYIYPDTKKD